MYDENCQSCYENSTIIVKYPIIAPNTSTSIQLTNQNLPYLDENDHTSHKSNITRTIISNTSGGKPRKNVIIKLPTYIINSHPITKKSEQDISQKYNIQLFSPDNERLYIANHYALLQVMTQYVYYRKLCVWIKEELAKKRLELLEVARSALISARDSNICSLEQMSDAELTIDEKKSLMKYAQEAAMEEFSGCHDSASCHENTNENKQLGLNRTSPNIPQTTTQIDVKKRTCHNQLDIIRPTNSLSPNTQSDYYQNLLRRNLPRDQNTPSDSGCDLCPSNLEKDFRIKRQQATPSCFDELYVCDRCGSGKNIPTTKGGKFKFKMEVDRGTNPELPCVRADICTCRSEIRTQNGNDKATKKCCVIL